MSPVCTAIVIFDNNWVQILQNIATAELISTRFQ